MIRSSPPGEVVAEQGHLAASDASKQAAVSRVKVLLAGPQRLLRTTWLPQAPLAADTHTLCLLPLGRGCLQKA